MALVMSIFPGKIRIHQPPRFTPPRLKIAPVRDVAARRDRIEGVRCVHDVHKTFPGARITMTELNPEKAVVKLVVRRSISRSSRR